MASLIAMVVAVPMVISEEATMTATVGNVAPEVTSVSVSPDSVTLNTCPDTTSITVTATVSDANGYEDITDVNITSINPAITGVSTPIPMTYVSGSGSGNTATYTATIDLPCCTTAGNYTVTVEAKDNAGENGTGTGTFTVQLTVAITVTDVDFGSVAPGGSSTASSTVTCVGNAAVKFVDVSSDGYDIEDDDGIVWSDMTSGTNAIADDNIGTSWSPATTISCNDSASVPFTLNVPAGTASGTYTGTITFTPSEA